MTLTEFGALVFGAVVGFITYRTLVRTVDKAAIGDLATVLGAIGGGSNQAVRPVRPAVRLVRHRAGGRHCIVLRRLFDDERQGRTSQGDERRHADDRCPGQRW
jgi:hypothetical protein